MSSAASAESSALGLAQRTGAWGARSAAASLASGERALGAVASGLVRRPTRMGFARISESLVDVPASSSSVTPQPLFEVALK